MGIHRQPFKTKIWSRFKYVDEEVPFTGDSKESQIHIRNLPSDLTDLECFEIFGKFGRIHGMRFCVAQHRFYRDKGYGFITYHDPISAEEAYNELNNFEIRKGLKLSVVLCRLQRRIMIKRIPTNKTEEEIIQQFSAAFDGIVSITVMKPFDDGAHIWQKNAGFAQLEFQSQSYARTAVRLLNSGQLRLWRKTLIANWTDRDSLHKHVILSGISNDVPERFLIDWLQISSRNGLVHCNWCYGRLNLEFNSNYQAQLAWRDMDGYEIGGSVLQFEWDLFPYNSSSSTMY